MDFRPSKTRFSRFQLSGSILRVSQSLAVLHKLGCPRRPFKHDVRLLVLADVQWCLYAVLRRVIGVDNMPETPNPNW